MNGVNYETLDPAPFAKGAGLTKCNSLHLYD